MPMAIAARLTDIYGQPIDIDRKMTADEFLEIVDRLPYRAELVNGEVVVNSPGLRHQDVVVQLVRRLYDWVDAAPSRGHCGFDVSTRFDEENVYRPDVWWYCEQRKPSLDQTYPDDIPDIAVEVLSPGNRRTDLGPKRDTYEQLGLPELWIIDPLVSATLWRRSATGSPAFDVTVKVELGDSLESPQLPGFSVRLDELFR
jgi:Uma2 family endonuclease